MKAACIRLSKGITSLAILAIIIFLLGGCASANHPPLITSLKAERGTLPPLGTGQIECIASDEDGDELSYEWSASNGNIKGNDSIVVWVAPESKGLYNIRVRVTDGNGGEATDYMTIKVGGNSPPTITSLIADEDWVAPSASCRIECNAEDADGDELSYEWSAKSGDISGTGPAVTWTAPEKAGLYDITVVVRDGYGGENIRSLTISVAAKPPLIIDSFIVTSEQPKYLQEYSEGYKIYKGTSCEIECVVKDARNDLVYEWSAEGGNILGEGPVVTWTAPDKGGKFTVTEMVSDSSGGVASKSVIFTVLTCTCAFGSE